LLTISLDVVVYPEEDTDAGLGIDNEDDANTEEDTNTEGNTGTEEGAIEPTGVAVNQTYSVQLLENIKILAVGEVLNKGDLDNSGGYSTVTLSVTPEQAAQLNLAVNTGRIRLILRSPLDSETIEVENIGVDDLLE
jgi:Flp pilus assembly protein CpaB